MNRASLARVLDVTVSLAMLGTAGILSWVALSNRAAPARPVASLELPKSPVSIEGAATEGRLDAPVGIVVFSDFQCPFCRSFALEILPDLRSEFIDKGQLLFAFRHLPIESIHPLAKRAAAIGECARRGGVFKAVHDYLFSEPKLTAATLEVLPSRLGLSGGLLSEECIEKYGIDAVEADLKSAASLGVKGTPNILVGRNRGDGTLTITSRLRGARSIDEVSSTIKNLLREAK